MVAIKGYKRSQVRQATATAARLVQGLCVLHWRGLITHDPDIPAARERTHSHTTLH